MCDEDTARETESYLKRLTRRKFNALAAGTAAAMMLPRTANALEVTGSAVEVPAPDGVCDAFFVRPSAGKHPAVLMWPDILALRPAFKTMATGLAESGYAVLCVNPYYRDARAPVVGEGESFQDKSTREKVLPYYRNLSAETHATDAKAFVSYLDAQDAVDASKKIGTMGYCMGGPIVFRTAAAVPERIGAAASYHGGGLVTDKPDSPHLLIPGMKAQFLVAIADNDDQRDPDAKEVLRKEFDAAGLPAEIEVYEGAMHGWCVLDSRVYNLTAAKKAWARTLALFARALG